MTDVLVKAEGVSKKFCKNLKRSMLYGMQDITQSMFGIAPETDNLKEKEFWAIDNISFELKRGECLGLIGPNGSGKSTLLKILNGIISPDKGRVSINGKVGALIEIGAGFHPQLTGRENIYINGSILGFSKKEIDKIFDKIVAFSELEEFIDMPIKNYSSGMYVRLGFAVAAQMEPDVLLIDEVLAVGDVGFRSKCYNRIAEMMRNSAIIFVSHFMPHIAKLCSKTILLKKGKAFYIDNVLEGIDKYNDLFFDRQGVVAGTGEAEISNFKLLNKDGIVTDVFEYDQLFQISFDIVISNKYDEYQISLTFMNQDSTLIAQCHSQYHGVIFKNIGQKRTIKIKINQLILNAGNYYINIIIYDKTNTKYLTWLLAVSKFKVSGNFYGGAPVQFRADWDTSTKECSM